jgi:hypothetical protein
MTTAVADSLVMRLAATAGASLSRCFDQKGGVLLKVSAASRRIWVLFHSIPFLVVNT